MKMRFILFIPKYVSGATFLTANSQQPEQSLLRSLNHKRKSAGVRTIAHPARLGLRIAHHPRISNAEAHAKLYILIGVEETR